MTSYPESKASEIWEKDGIQYSIIRTHMGHYCGYCRFVKRPVIETGYNGFLTYVPVHGGITYAEQDEDGTMVYGFDCAHSGDEMKPELRDIEWLKAECERMATAIQEAAKYERDYLESIENEQKAEILDKYHDELQRTHGIAFIVSDNFGSMLKIMFGTL